jgi:hypothetical protein
VLVLEGPRSPLIGKSANKDIWLCERRAAERWRRYRHRHHVDPPDKLDELAGFRAVVGAGFVEMFADEMKEHFLTIAFLRIARVIQLSRT